MFVCVCVSVTVTVLEKERERDILKKYQFHMAYNIHHYMWVIVVKWMTIAEECVRVCACLREIIFAIVMNIEWGWR